MQLVFLWMNKDKGIIHDLSLQLSPQHPCTYDMETRTLKKEAPESHFNVFSKYASPVSNVSVLVGENGSGKTTIIREMFEILRRGSSSCQFLALYYGKLQKDNCCSDAYYYWSNLEREGAIHFVNGEFASTPPRKLSKKDVESEFFFIRYTDVLSFNEYAEGGMASTRNSRDLTMAGRLINAGNNNRHLVPLYRQDLVLQLYHAETELQIQSLKTDMPFKIKNLDVRPCQSIDRQTLELQAAKNGNVWMDLSEEHLYEPKEEACSLCLEILDRIERLDSTSRADVIVKSIIYTYLRYVINKYRIFSVEKPGTGISAAIKRDVNKPIAYWQEKLPLNYGENPCNEIAEMFGEALEDCDLPYGEVHFIDNLKVFMNWFFYSDMITYDENADKFHVAVEPKHVDELLAAFRGYSNSIGKYGEAFSFEFIMSSGERAFFNMFAYMNYAKEQMDSVDKIKIIGEDNRSREGERNVVLMWDEMDAFLHPRWQQMGLARVLEYIGNIFKGHDIQMLLSTHSPLLLLDVPLSHINFLRKSNDKIEIINKQYQTFADNIYRLYEDSFFMNAVNENELSNKVWVRGAFADKVIKIADSLMDNIQEYLTEEISIEECRGYIAEMKDVYEIIKIIGEPFLQRLMLGRWQELNAMLKRKGLEDKL